MSASNPLAGATYTLTIGGISVTCAARGSHRKIASKPPTANILIIGSPVYRILDLVSAEQPSIAFSYNLLRFRPATLRFPAGSTPTIPLCPILDLGFGGRLPMHVGWSIRSAAFQGN